MRTICLITDLGTKDYFVGSMKGTILSIDPKTKIIDITHQIPKHDVKTGAFILVNSAKYFPENSIFVVVVDPDVGTERKCILLKTRNDLIFIGPDNGILSPVGEKFGKDEIREINNTELMNAEVSNTFHGRDIMAPVAAHISRGVNFRKVGPRINKMNSLIAEEPTIKEGKISAQILHIDDFGNLITNVHREKIKGLTEPPTTFKISKGRTEFEVPFVNSFGEVPEGGKLCYIGSTKLLEIAKNRGNLAKEMEISKSDELNIRI